MYFIVDYLVDYGNSAAGIQNHRVPLRMTDFPV